MQYFRIVLKTVFGFFLALFALSSLLSGSYLQTVSLITLIISLFYWPFLKGNPGWKTPARVLFIFLVLILQITVFKPDPKTSIYSKEDIKSQLHKQYKKQLANWPEQTERIYLETEFGKVHVLALGNPDLPAVLLLHAASMGAHSWAENLSALSGEYRIYAVDHPGEGNLSELNNALQFPIDGKEVADLYAAIADGLGVKNAHVIGASNGGFIAQLFALHHPERVRSLSLLAPMGLTELSNNSVLMMSLPSLYPIKPIRTWVCNWALGEDPYTQEVYGKWFDLILAGTLPSIARPQPLDAEQKSKMQKPILLFLGTNDPIVGNVDKAVARAEKYPNIDIQVFESGHMIGVEQRTAVNLRLAKFLEEQTATAD